MKSRLYRSQSDRMLGGVCGGLGSYLGVDPVIVRLVFVVALLAGPGLLLYPVMWAIIPSEDRIEATPNETIEAGTAEMAEQARTLGARLRHESSGGRSTGGMIAGAILLMVGVVALANNLGITWLRWLTMDLVGPVVLILIGLAIIQRRARTA